MQNIVIKSNIKNRVRLKSKLFTPQNFITIEQILANDIMSIRLNELCFSIIITYDDTKTDIKTILDKIYSVTPKTFLAKTATKVACECKRCEITKPNPQSLKTKVKKFMVLSIVAVYVFVKEHILVTPFSPVFSLGLTALSLYMAKPLIAESIESFKNKKLNLESFMAFSLLLAIFSGEITAAFEVIYILTGSRLFEEYTANLSRAEIKNLIKMDVTKLYVLRGDVEVEINLEDVSKDDIAVFVSGEKICVDGVIIKGEALINEALINGRSRSTLKKVGDDVFANTSVEQGRVFVRVSAVGSDTYIARVISDVEKSLDLKSKSEIMADVLAKKVLKIGSAMTAFTLLVTRSFTNAFSVMIVMSCPCATILAASSAISSAIAHAARNGILIKGGEYLEKVSKASVFCFDKTGTLTTGLPVIKDYEALIDEKEFLEILVNLEHKNTHPVAKAITKFCNEKGFVANSDSHAKNEVGLGVSSEYKGDSYLLGNLKFMTNSGVKVAKKENKAYTNIYLAKNGKLAGSVSLTHDIRPYSFEMLKELRDRGVQKIVLLTGDDELVSKEFASGFEFDEIYYDLMPNEKADIVDELSKHGGVVMIGDGVNDTLAMSRADVSISFASGGSKAAVEVSNIAITKSDPKDIIKLYDLSKFTLKVANQNYQIGTSTNILGSFLAMFGAVGPRGAGLIHIAHTLAILLNSNRVK